jgi:hypothetical protein
MGKTVAEFVENKPASLDLLCHPAQPTELIAQIVLWQAGTAPH